MTQIDASKYTKIPLGRQGENLARQIVFDLSDFLSVYGSGVAELIHQRPGDTVPYPVPAVRDGGTLVWTVSNVDTQVQTSCLYGQCELRWYVGEVLVKSRIWRTLVEPAMDTPSETVPPEPQQGWVEQVVAAGAAAAAAADKAEDALTKAPVIGASGNWFVWDAAKGDYTDTGRYAGGRIPYIGSNGHWYIGTEDSGVPATGAAGKDGQPGADGADGKSAYELACENGFEGTLTQWLASLVGAKGDTGAAGSDGANGKSAYELACENGYSGTITEWLASLVGEAGRDGVNGADGTNGKSAYELAVVNGYEGTEQQWLASLVGAAGSNGKSAYELACENGYQGDVQTWLASLVGPAGPDGKAGSDGYTPVRGTDYWTEDDKAQMVSDVLAALPVWDGGVV